MGEPSVSVLAHFGRELKHHRERVGLTQEQVGERVGYSNGLISQIENARRMPSEQLAASLDEVLDTGGAFRRLYPLVREHAATTPTFRDYLEREPTATAIYTYESFLVPGLLQTEDYARQLQEAARPTLPTEEMQSRVAARMSRQDVFARHRSPQLWVVLGEAVLHCLVGSATVMRDQLHRLLEHARQPAITLQVLPFRAGAGPALGQSFLLADFATGPSAFHVDSQAAAQSDRANLDSGRYKLRFDHLRVLALPEDDSHAMITRQIEELSEDDD